MTTAVILLAYLFVLPGQVDLFILPKLFVCSIALIVWWFR